MLVEFIAMVNTVMIFKGTGNYNIPGFYGINVVFHNERHIAAQVYIYFAFFVNVRIVYVFN